jgi:hypothetical protein
MSCIRTSCFILQRRILRSKNSGTKYKYQPFCIPNSKFCILLLLDELVLVKTFTLFIRHHKHIYPTCKGLNVQ